MPQGGGDRVAGGDLHRFEVPPEQLIISEFCFRMKVDFTKPFKGNDEVQQIKRIITGLLNTSGGVFEIQNTDVSTTDPPVLGEWKRNLEDSLISFIPRSIYRSSIRLLDYSCPIVIIVYKSSKLITLSSNMWERGLATNRAVNDVDTIMDVITQTSEKQPSHPFQDVRYVKYEDELSVCEGPNVEYKYWGAVKVFDGPGERNTYKVRFEDERTTRSLLAFANMAAGGFLIIGIDEDKKSRRNVIRGQSISESDEVHLTEFVSDYLKKDQHGHLRIWGAQNVRGSPQLGEDWNIKFIPVTGGPQNERRRVIVINVKHYPGGVMSQCPESYFVTEEGHVNKIPLHEWIERMGLSQESRIPFRHKFQRSCSYTQTDNATCTVVNQSSQTNNENNPSGSHCVDPRVDSVTQEEDCPTTVGVDTTNKPEVSSHGEISESTEKSHKRSGEISATDEPPNKRGMQSLSFTKNKEAWRSVLRMTSCSVEDNVRNFASNVTVFRPEKQMRITPSRSTIMSIKPQISGEMGNALDYIQADIDKSATTGSEGSFALAASNLTSNMRDARALPCPEHHVLDILVVAASGCIKFWTIVDNVNIDVRATWKYTIVSARLVKRSVLLQHLTNSTVPHLSSFRIECRLYQLNKGEVPSPKHNTPLYGQELDNILNAPARSMDDMKMCLATALLKKGTRINSIFGDEHSIFLTAEQMDLIMSIGFDRFNYIEGPPGSGKTYSALHLCQKHTNYGFVCSRPTFQNYLIHQGLDSHRLFSARTSDDLMSHLNKRSFEGLDILIIDDVQGLTFSEEAWLQLFKFIVKSDFTKLVVFGDSFYQRYMASAVVCLDVMRRFCKEHNCHLTEKVLSQIHRNTKKVVSFILSNFTKSEAFPDHTMISCSHPEDGDDVEIVQLIGVFNDSDNNSLVKLIEDLTDPQANINNECGAYEPKDIAILLDTLHPQVDATALTTIFRKYVPGNVTVNNASSFPVTGYTIDTLDNFMGMDRRVCILITGKNILQSTDSAGRSIVNPRYKTFAASRAIARVIFIVETSLDTTLASHFNIDNIMPFIQKVWLEEEGNPINDLCIAYMDDLPIVLYIRDCCDICAIDFSGNSIDVEVDVKDMKKIDRIASSLDGKRIVVAGWDSQDDGPYWWTTYSLLQGKLVKNSTYHLPQRPWSVCWTPDGDIFTALRDSIALLSPLDGRTKWYYEERSIGIKSSHRATSLGKSIYISDGRSRDVVELDTETAAIQRKISTANVPGSLWSLTLDSSEKYLFVGSLDHSEVYLLEMARGTAHKVIDAPDAVWELALHDDRFLVLSSAKGCALYDVSAVL